MESLPLFLDASSEKPQDTDGIDKGIVIPVDEIQCHREQQRRDEAETETSTGCVMGDIAIFRDFFLAAFSDGYYNVRISIVGGVILRLACTEQWYSAVLRP
jgi:hypothetical protein